MAEAHEGTLVCQHILDYREGFTFAMLHLFTLHGPIVSFTFSHSIHLLLFTYFDADLECAIYITINIASLQRLFPPIKKNKLLLFTPLTLHLNMTPLQLRAPHMHLAYTAALPLAATAFNLPFTALTYAHTE